MAPWKFVKASERAMIVLFQDEARLNESWSLHFLHCRSNYICPCRLQMNVNNGIWKNQAYLYIWCSNPIPTVWHLWPNSRLYGLAKITQQVLAWMLFMKGYLFVNLKFGTWTFSCYNPCLLITPSLSSWCCRWRGGFAILLWPVLCRRAFHECFSSNYNNCL